jgi:hypothetical protein
MPGRCALAADVCTVDTDSRRGACIDSTLRDFSVRFDDTAWTARPPPVAGMVRCA